MNTMTMKRPLLAILTATICVSQSLAFVNRPALLGGSSKSFSVPPKSSSRTTQRLSMYLDGSEHALAHLVAPVMTSTIAIPSGSLLSTASSALIDPAVESELFNDFAHVGLDLSTFVRPATVLLRLSIVIGRICAILSDYLPDGTMNPEEVVFQSLMLIVAAGACLQSFLPLVLAATAKMTYRDGRAYSKMFQPLGITWTQYKAMVAVALDWVQVEPHEYVTKQQQDKNETDNQYMYWLYAGDAQLRCSSGKYIQNVTASGSGYNGLFGELQFAQLLDKTSSSSTGTTSKSPDIQAGGTGATLVRIHVKKLRMLMDQDEKLAEAIQSLLVKGMQEKLSAFMEQDSNQ